MLYRHRETPASFPASFLQSLPLHALTTHSVWNRGRCTPHNPSTQHTPSSRRPLSCGVFKPLANRLNPTPCTSCQNP